MHTGVRSLHVLNQYLQSALDITVVFSLTVSRTEPIILLYANHMFLFYGCKPINLDATALSLCLLDRTDNCWLGVRGILSAHRAADVDVDNVSAPVCISCGILGLFAQPFSSIFEPLLRRSVSVSRYPNPLC